MLSRRTTRGADVQVGGFPSHHAEQLALVAPSGHVGQLDARAVGREAPHDPPIATLEKRIARPNRPLQERRLIVTAHPFARGCRRNARLRFASDQRAAEVAERDESRTSEAADAGYAANDPIALRRLRPDARE